MNSSVMEKTGLVLLAGLVGLAASAWADDFNPSLSPLPTIPTIGESRICSSSLGAPLNCGTAVSITVDWAVGFDVLTHDFIYFYGVETNTSTDVASWEIDFAPGSITSAGFINGTSFDSEIASFFGLSLGPEDESISGSPVDPTSVVPFSPGASTDHVTWGFDNPTTGAHNLLSGLQSSVLLVHSPFHPVFGFGSGSDSGHGGSPWSTSAPGSNPVPVPGDIPVSSDPESSSIILLGSALFAIAAASRRRFTHKYRAGTERTISPTPHA